jgi:hypothetical protein
MFIWTSGSWIMVKPHIPMGEAESAYMDHVGGMKRRSTWTTTAR